ncbi:MAG TPA: CAP domain-containing protein [Patescibacteria group bacterium]|nr:CAP domain-containing protein [Patescibacteria group bacterium]
MAASFLLGTMLVLTVAWPAQAATSDPLLNTLVVTPTASENSLCLATIPEPLSPVNEALQPAVFQPVVVQGQNSVVITQAKDPLAHSFGSDSAVATQVTQNTQVDTPVTPTPVLQAPSATVSAAPVLPESAHPLDADVIFNLVNTTRAQYGLPAFQKDDRICAIAQSRTSEINNEIWVTHTMHAGFYARNLPYRATENLISMQTEEQAVDWWMHSPVHRAALLGNWKYACVACSGNSCSMIFTNFEPKVAASLAQASDTATPTSVAATSTPIIGVK